MLVHIFTTVARGTVGKDKLDVMVPGVDCGEGCTVQQREHGQVVHSFLRFANLAAISAIVFAISINDVLLGPQKGMSTQIPLETTF